MRVPPLPLLLLLPGAAAFSPAALPPSPSTRLRVAPSAVRPPAPSSLAVASTSPSAIARRRRSVPRSYPASRSATSLRASAASASRQFEKKKRIAILMSFMTGWADYIFIKKHGFFATMMTGNSMKMADALVSGRTIDALYFLSIIASYIIGVGVFRRAELSYKERALNGLFAPVVAGCFLWSDYLYWTDPTGRFVPAALLSFAWGIVNSVGSEVTGTLIFVVTGAMTRLSNMIVDSVSRTAGRKPVPKEGFLMSLSVIGGFILGAAWSALLSIRAPKLMTRGAFSIMGGIYGLLFLWLDREQMGAWWGRGDGKLCEIDAEEVDCK